MEYMEYPWSGDGPVFICSCPAGSCDRINYPVDTQEDGGKKEINTTCAVAIHGKFSEAADFVVAGVCWQVLQIAKGLIAMNRHPTNQAE